MDNRTIDDWVNTRYIVSVTRAISEEKLSSYGVDNHVLRVTDIHGNCYQLHDNQIEELQQLMAEFPNGYLVAATKIPKEKPEIKRYI